MNNKIKAIAFDFGGVIVPGIILHFIKKLPTGDPKRKYFDEASNKWDIGEMSIDQFYEALSCITNIPLDRIRETYFKNPEVFQETVKLVKKLKKNYKVVLFSNNFTHNIMRYFDELTMHDLFDEHIISSEHKMKKPDPRFYQKMLEILQMQPSEVIFIDDMQVNVDTGNAMGIHSLLFSNAQKLKQALEKLQIKV